MKEGQYFVRDGVIVRIARMTKSMVMLDTPEGIRRVTKAKFSESSLPISRQQRRRILRNSQRTNNAKKREKMHQFAHPSITYPSKRRDDEWTQKGIMA